MTGREAPRTPAANPRVVDTGASVPAVTPGPHGTAVAGSPTATALGAATGAGAAAAGSVPSSGSVASSGSVSSSSSASSSGSAGPLPVGEVVVPDYPPQEHLLPPAPTSPAVQVPPFDTAPLPVSPVDAAEANGPLTPPVDPTHSTHAPAPVQPPAPAAPAAPAVGQPRFSVPGLEHVLVEGTEPEPSGPIGYRTPARFARQQAPRPVVVAPAPNDFDAVIAAPATASASASAPTPSVFPGTLAAAARAVTGAPGPSAAPVVPAEPSAAGAPARRRGSGTRGRDPRSESATQQPGVDAEVGAVDGGERGLQPGRGTARDRSRTAIGVTPAAVLGAVTGVAAIALAAWWFTAPATVHATGLVLGVLALALSGTALRSPAATWQRPVGLLGAVLGGVGTLVLLWAVAAALLAPGGVALPDLTGTGVTPTVAP
ncbi:hypothetical protein QUG98_08355 [Curtobacterium sp. RHCJP20]|uniref:Uncharacterized protein n=1 Tax=Curtobacterium subtropicum TaxID=3055138 RepID=A0ABT7TFZ2_9MICO|nr:hypothetical protein [Curtobacterium subtropicum]